MKIVLVNPLWSFKNILPLNLAELAGYIRKNGHPDISIVDLNYELKGHLILDHIIEKAVEIVLARKPDVIGLTCNTIHVPFWAEFCREFKKRSRIPIVLGGIHPTFMPEKMFALSGADFIVRGEGEETFLELLNALNRKEDPGTILGLSYIQKNKILHNADRPLIKDLSRLPLPAYDLLLPYVNRMRQKKNEKDRILEAHFCATRGCPYGCIFCSSNAMWKYQRRKPVAQVVEEIKYLNTKFNCDFIAFGDDCLPLNKAWFSGLLGKLKNLKLTWSCLSRTDILDNKLLRRMKDSGCVEIYHGIESGSSRIRKLINKNLDPAVDNNAIAELVREEKRTGIKVTCSFMTGIPTETKNEMCETIHFAGELKGLGAVVQYWVMTPYPDVKATAIYRKHLIKFNRWKILRQSDLYNYDQFFLYAGFYERYHKENPDFYMFRPDMPIKDFLRIYREGINRLGLEDDGSGRLYNYIKETCGKKYFIGLEKSCRPDSTKHKALSSRNCADCHRLFKVNSAGEIVLCTGRKMCKEQYVYDRSSIYTYFLNSGMRELEQSRRKSLCPYFPKDKGSLEHLRERYYKGMVYVAKAQKCFSDGDIKQCIDYVMKARRADCSHGMTCLLLGLCYKRSGRYDKAIAELRTAENIYPCNAQINIALLKCYSKTGEKIHSGGQLLKAYRKIQRSRSSA